MDVVMIFKYGKRFRYAPSFNYTELGRICIVCYIIMNEKETVHIIYIHITVDSQLSKTLCLWTCFIGSFLWSGN